MRSISLHLQASTQAVTTLGEFQSFGYMQHNNEWLCGVRASLGFSTSEKPAVVVQGPNIHAKLQRITNLSLNVVFFGTLGLPGT